MTTAPAFHQIYSNDGELLCEIVGQLTAEGALEAAADYLTPEALESAYAEAVYPEEV